MGLVLALDTSQLQAAVCLIEQDKVRAAQSGSIDVAHSEALLPLIHGVLAKASGAREPLALGALDAFAVGVGPGSFTGIRIGCATVKALGQVLSKPIVAFSSLRATALSVADDPGVVALVNAYRGQVFAGWFDASGAWREEALPVEQWCDRELRQLSTRVGRVRFCGTGTTVYWPKLSSRADVAAAASRTDVVYATPEGIAQAIRSGESLHYSKLAANYLRPSEAEVKLGGKLAESKGGC